MAKNLRKAIGRVPFLGPVLRRAHGWATGTAAVAWKGNSADYWEQRYNLGGNSGAGSYGKFAEFKAEVLNAFVDEQDIDSVIEFGCGDGAQLKLARYRRYLGLDISPAAVARCREQFDSEDIRFALIDDYDGEQADLTLSLDVVYHLVEDAVFEEYMRKLFAAATRFVVIYSSNKENSQDFENTHVRHRVFTRWVEENERDWGLLRHIPNHYPVESDPEGGSFADFYIFELTGATG